MSSSKIRMQIRIKRLQDIYKALGKDPNAKEYEVKTLVQDFDKVSRKLIAKIKKAKNEQLHSRMNILLRYGLRSSQRVTIDEEITTLIKGMEHDEKRLNGILTSYSEKRGNELGEQELNNRQKVAGLLQECVSMFKRVYKDQTKPFELGKKNVQENLQNDKVNFDSYLQQVSIKLEELEKQNLLNSDLSDQQFNNNFGLLQHVYLPATQAQSGGTGLELFHYGGGSGAADNELGDDKKKSHQYEPQLRLQHSYFLATMLNFRSTSHFIFDLLLIILAMTFFFAGIQQLIMKGVMRPTQCHNFIEGKGSTFSYQIGDRKLLC